MLGLNLNHVSKRGHRREHGERWLYGFESVFLTETVEHLYCYISRALLNDMILAGHSSNNHSYMKSVVLHNRDKKR